MLRKEFEILLTLMSHPVRIYSREALLSEIWPDEVVVLDRVVDVNVTRIRQKIGPYDAHLPPLRRPQLHPQPQPPVGF